MGTLALWTLWLLLVIGIGIHARIAFGRELAVPDFLLHQIEARLAASGFDVTFGAAVFDPKGHLLLRQVELRSTSLSDPLLHAEAVYVQFDPWALPLRSLDLRYLEIVSARLLVPAMLSPSGRTEPLLDEGNAIVEFGPHQELNIRQFSARFGPVAITAEGQLIRPPINPDAPPNAVPLLQMGLRNYPAFARRLAAVLANLPTTESPQLDLHLTPDVAHLARVRARFSARSITTTGHEFPQAKPISATHLLLVSTLPLLIKDATDAARTVHGSLATLDAGRWGRADQIAFTIQGRQNADHYQPVLTDLDLFLGTLASQNLNVRDTRATAHLRTPTDAQLDLVTWLESEPWAAHATINPMTRAGQAEAGGRLPYRMVEWAKARSGIDLTALLKFDETPHVEARVELGDGGQPLAASGRLSTGPVVARQVALDATGATFRWRPGHVRFDDILLKVGASQATGSYEMDTDTLDFRFLLAGQLAPANIDGWFRDWWSNFWTNFEFPAGRPPVASVDILGQWKRPELTQVFVEADGRDPRLKTVPFDRIRTRIFVRPEFTDVLDFIGERPEGIARGGFRRSWDQVAREVRWTDFDIAGHMDLNAAAAIFPDIGPSIVAPFTFSAPPDLKLRGRISGPADNTGLPAIDVAVSGEATGPWTFYDFPLEGVVFSAHQVNDVLTVSDLTVGFAGGRAVGNLELSGPKEASHLAFDLSLSEAVLGQAIGTLESWSALRDGLPPPEASKFQQRIAAGRLDVALSAEGPAGDPYGFIGEGNATVTKADFGEINLFGILSTLMRRTLLDFSTLELNTARANFDLAGNRLLFSELTFNGPRASIESSGNYRLDTKRIAITAKVLPFDSSRGLLGSTLGAVLTPLSHALEVKLTGTLADPSWAFSYGPTSFFRALIGNDNEQDPAPPPSFGAPLSPPLPHAPASLPASTDSH